MDLACGEGASELLRAHCNAWKLIFNFMNSMSVKCAIQLGIPDIIHNHGLPMTLQELITELPITPTKSHCIHRLMRILLHSGFFELKKFGPNNDKLGYVLNHTSQLLLKDNPLSIRTFALAMLDPVLTDPWHGLSTWFQNDNLTPFDTTHGMSFWNLAGHEPKFNDLFNDAMASDARFVANVVVNECKGVFGGLNSLVDVGGGTGEMAKVLVAAFPELECTVLDLPHVVAGLKGDDKVKYVGGDMFEKVPQADAILLKSIIHDWTDEDGVKILKKCREAISLGKEKLSKVIIIDMVMESQKRDNEKIETQLFFDMMMMVLLPGRERTEEEWAKLFFDAGFSKYKILPILGTRSLIEVYV